MLGRQTLVRRAHCRRIPVAVVDAPCEHRGVRADVLMDNRPSCRGREALVEDPASLARADIYRGRRGRRYGRPGTAELAIAGATCVSRRRLLPLSPPR